MSPRDQKLLEKLSRGIRKGKVSANIPWQIAWACNDIPIDDPDYEPDCDRYVFALVECRMCGDQHLAFYPADVVDETMLECENCKHPTCEPVADKRVWMEVEECN